MATVQLKKSFYFIMCVLPVTGHLQLLTHDTTKTVINETDCYCNGTNLRMMVDERFLDHWLKFNFHHSTRHLSETAENLATHTNDHDLQASIARDCVHANEQAVH